MPLGRSGNLRSMDTDRNELRARVARGWPGSGLTQAAYAKQNGISARTLRSWVSQFVPTRLPPGTEARDAMVEAIAKLQAVLDDIDRAAADAADASVFRRDAEPVTDPASGEPPPVGSDDRAEERTQSEVHGPRMESYFCDL
jgi:transposase-like protein